MRFGVCCWVDGIEAVKNNGYDYFEGPFSHIALVDDKTFDEEYRIIEKFGLPAEAFNGFFAPEISLNNDVDYDYIKNYAEKGFSRASKIGGKVAVIGSGRSRNIPDGYDRELATKQFLNILNICGDIGSKYGMQIVIEPLNSNETNFINTVADGIEISRRANHSNVKCLADFFHVFKSGESLDAIKNAGNLLGHVHLARPNEDRGCPTAADIESLKAYADALKISGYNKRISLECIFKPDFNICIEQAKPVLDMFK